MDDQYLIASLEFGFRKGQRTIKLIHRVINNINEALEEKKFCSSAFLDITQAFDKVSPKGLLFEVQNQLPHQ